MAVILNWNKNLIAPVDLHRESMQKLSHLVGEKKHLNSNSLKKSLYCESFWILAWIWYQVESEKCIFNNISLTNLKFLLLVGEKTHFVVDQKFRLVIWSGGNIPYRHLMKTKSHSIILILKSLYNYSIKSHIIS